MYVLYFILHIMNNTVTLHNKYLQFFIFNNYLLIKIIINIISCLADLIFNISKHIGSKRFIVFYIVNCKIQKFNN